MPNMDFSKATNVRGIQRRLPSPDPENDSDAEESGVTQPRQVGARHGSLTQPRYPGRSSWPIGSARFQQNQEFAQSYELRSSHPMHRRAASMGASRNLNGSNVSARTDLISAGQQSGPTIPWYETRNSSDATIRLSPTRLADTKYAENDMNSFIEKIYIVGDSRFQPHLAELRPSVRSYLFQVIEDWIENWIKADFPWPFDRLFTFPYEARIPVHVHVGCTATNHSCRPSKRSNSSNDRSAQEHTQKKQCVRSDAVEEGDAAQVLVLSKSKNHLQADLLACHFNKFDAMKFKDRHENGRLYKTCTNGFKSIKDLKEHHWRVHRPKYFCRRCHTISKKEQDAQSHAAEIYACEINHDPSFEVEYIVTSPRLEVFTKKSCKTTNEQHWYMMWEILFPDSIAPEDPYCQHILSIQNFPILDRLWDQSMTNALPNAVRLANYQLGPFLPEGFPLQTLIQACLDIYRQQVRITQEVLSVDNENVAFAESVVGSHGHLANQVGLNTTSQSTGLTSTCTGQYQELGMAISGVNELQLERCNTSSTTTKSTEAERLSDYQFDPGLMDDFVNGDLSGLNEPPNQKINNIDNLLVIPESWPCVVPDWDWN